jgi:hypothetical protein
MRIPQVSHSIDLIKRQVTSVREHMDVILSTVTTVSTTLFFLGKAFPQVPDTLTRTAFLIRNAIGLAFLDWQVSFARKTVSDCWLAARTRTVSTCALAAATAINAFSDIFLVIAGTAAALASWANRVPIAHAIYAVTRPWGISFLVLTIALDVFSHIAHRSLHGDLTQLANGWFSSRRAYSILSCLNAFEAGKSLNGFSVDDARLATRIRSSMDKYTLQTLLDAHRSSPLRSSAQLQLIIKNVGTQMHYTHLSIGLRAAGYVGLLLCKAYPDSLIQATTLLSISLSYTSSQIYKRWQEAKHRFAINQ